MDEKAPPPRDLLTRIEEIARKETGAPFPPSLAESVRAKLQSLRLSGSDASKVVR